MMTPERLEEIKKFSNKTVQTWSAMECPKEEMIYELLQEIHRMREKLDIAIEAMQRASQEVSEHDNFCITYKGEPRIKVSVDLEIALEKVTENDDT